MQLGRFRKFMQRWTNKPDDDLFVTLVQVAIEDPHIGQQLATLLSLHQVERRSRLKQWQHELVVDGAPEAFINILTRLEDEAVANQTLLVLQKASAGQPD